MEINQYSEDSLTLEFEDKISPKTNQLIVNLEQWIKDQEIVGLIETVISFTNLLIYFDPMKSSREEIIKKLDQVDFEALRQKPLPSRIFEIPVCYGGKYGPDLDLFEENGLTPQEVIDLHANKEYLVYMLGFMPGFVYLGGLDERIFKDRLNNPRTNIPAGSVGIGGNKRECIPLTLLVAGIYLAAHHFVYMIRAGEKTPFYMVLEIRLSLSQLQKSATRKY